MDDSEGGALVEHEGVDAGPPIDAADAPKRDGPVASAPSRPGAGADPAQVDGVGNGSALTSPQTTGSSPDEAGPGQELSMGEG